MLNAQKCIIAKCCALRGSLNLMAPNFELCCFCYRNFIGNHMIRLTV